ncbi:copper-translocating P-type ATPase [Methylophaga sp. 41_12_T18]|nr:copper-translocating P-type ATPase [Methylophaga sp. 41_12_T18]
MTLSANCYHCALPVEKLGLFTHLVGGLEREFCCFGCQTVCQTIYNSGLQSFYQKMPEGETSTPPVTPSDELSSYDSDEIQVDYVDSLAEERTIHLLVEGIHCAACVWLIEHSLAKQSGIVSAEVNLTAKRLRLRWNNTATNLSTLLRALAMIGYIGVPFDPDTAEDALAKRHRGLLYRMAFAGFAAMNLMWISIALYAGADQGEFRNWFQWIGCMIATPTLLYAGYPFLRNAVIGLRRRYLTMDLPIAIGATATYCYSVYITSTSSQTGDVYFDTVVNFLFVILVGRYLEAISKREALSATRRLLELQPKLATVIINKNPKIVPVRLVKIGDQVLIKPGEKIPVDGSILDGNTAVDESMLTGESIAVAKVAGDNVVAGSINGEGAITVQAEQVLRNTALAKIVTLMEDAQTSKAPIQSLADRVVPWFVLITLSLATLTFVYWYQTDFEIALLAATSVLIITCPCAFGLATPMSVAVATGVGSSRGILIKQGAALESLSQVSHIVFDKTGTLTDGNLRLVSSKTVAGLSDDELLQLAASVEQHSEHSIARAICQQADERDLMLSPLLEFMSFPGEGVQANLSDKQVQLGTLTWMNKLEVSGIHNWHSEIAEIEQQGVACIFVAVNGRLAGLLGLLDELRPEVKSMIKALQQQGITITVLSGDRTAVVHAVTADLGEINRHAEVLPKDKVNVVKALQSQGDIVAMVGDGVNDAPALIQANIGIALASGTDVSIESADIVLSHNELNKVLEARILASKTLRTIKQNIVLSISYNIIMVPLAMMALVSPIVAALTMPISSLLVIANAARIRRLFER